MAGRTHASNKILIWWFACLNKYVADIGRSMSVKTLYNRWYQTNYAFNNSVSKLIARDPNHFHAKTPQCNKYFRFCLRSCNDAAPYFMCLVLINCGRCSRLKYVPKLSLIFFSVLHPATRTPFPYFESCRLPFGVNGTVCPVCYSCRSIFHSCASWGWGVLLNEALGVCDL